MSGGNILFVCNHNSARSQMAEYLLKTMYGDDYFVASAGAMPAENINPLARAVLEELEIDVSDAKTKNFEDLGSTKFDYIISVCDAKAEECPAFVFGVTPLNLGVPDPSVLAAATDDEEVKLRYFRDTRDQLRQIVRNAILLIESGKRDKQTPEQVKKVVEEEFREKVGNQITAYLNEALLINCPPNDEIICVPQSKITLIMIEKSKNLVVSDIWAWFGLAVSLGTTIVTADFKDIFLAGAQWKILFILAFILSTLKTCHVVWKQMSGDSIEDFIDSVVSESKGQGLTAPVEKRSD